MVAGKMTDASVTAMKTEPSDAFEIHRKMMTSTGIWPQENSDKTYKTKTAISWFLSVAIFIIMWIDLIYNITDFAKLSEILYIMVTFVAYLTKLIMFTYYKKTFLDMVCFLQDPVFVSFPYDLNHYMKTSTRASTIIANVYRYLILIVVLMYVVYPILDRVPLPFPFPYDLGKYTYFMYVFEIIAEACAAFNHTCLDTLCIALMGIGSAQLDILAEKISRLKQEEDTEEDYVSLNKTDRQTVITYLKQCVKHHLAIIKFIGTVEVIFTAGLFCQFLASAIVICNTFFHFILIPLSLQFFMLAVYFAAMLVQVFMLCWYGDNILEKSRKIGEACYMSNWYLCGKDVRNYLMIIMERSKRPLQITTLNFATLSLAAFLSILQWSYSYLTLLLRLYYKTSPKQ